MFSCFFSCRFFMFSFLSVQVVFDCRFLSLIFFYLHASLGIV